MAIARTKKPAKEATHPKFNEMIATAIETLKEKGGSSRVAIIKFITSKYKVIDNPNLVNSQLKLALKKGVASGVLAQVKGTGASGSFKLSKKAAVKPEKTTKEPAKKVTPNKVKAKKVSKSPKVLKLPKVSKSPKKAVKSPKKEAAKNTTAKKAAKPNVKPVKN